MDIREFFDSNLRFILSQTEDLYAAPAIQASMLAFSESLSQKGIDNNLAHELMSVARGIYNQEDKNSWLPEEVWSKVIFPEIIKMDSKAITSCIFVSKNFSKCALIAHGGVG